MKQTTLQGGGYTILPALFCRRYPNPTQIAYLRGKRYETEKKIWGGQGGNRFTGKVESCQSDNSVNSAKTNENLAKEAGYQFDNHQNHCKTVR